MNLKLLITLAFILGLIALITNIYVNDNISKMKITHKNNYVLIGVVGR